MIALIVCVQYLPPAGDGSTEYVAFALHPQYGATGPEAHEALLRRFERAQEVWYVFDQNGLIWSFLLETVAAFCVLDVTPGKLCSTVNDVGPEV